MKLSLSIVAISLGTASAKPLKTMQYKRADLVVSMIFSVLVPLTWTTTAGARTMDLAAGASEWTHLQETNSLGMLPGAGLAVLAKSRVTRMHCQATIPLHNSTVFRLSHQLETGGSDLIADVAYDIFTGPISSSGSAITKPTIRGNSWKLFQGTNAATTVFSFVAASEIQSYYGDLIDFFNYLVSHPGFSTSQYVQSIGAGTEPFTGSNAVFTTTAYTLSI